MNISQKVAKRLFFGSLGFGGLGFCRGVQCYNYEYQRTLNFYKDLYDNERYMEYCKENPYLYRNMLGYSIIISVLYFGPGTNFLFLIKELERIEIDVRGLERTKNYYRIF